MKRFALHQANQFEELRSLRGIGHAPAEVQSDLTGAFHRVDSCLGESRLDDFGSEFLRAVNDRVVKGIKALRSGCRIEVASGRRDGRGV